MISYLPSVSRNLDMDETAFPCTHLIVFTDNAMNLNGRLAVRPQT